MSALNSYSISIETNDLWRPRIFLGRYGVQPLETTSHVERNYPSITVITFQTGASLRGRALAQTAVIFDGNTLVKP